MTGGGRAYDPTGWATGGTVRGRDRPAANRGAAPGTGPGAQYPAGAAWSPAWQWPGGARSYPPPSPQAPWPGGWQATPGRYSFPATQTVAARPLEPGPGRARRAPTGPHPLLVDFGFDARVPTVARLQILAIICIAAALPMTYLASPSLGRFFQISSTAFACLPGPLLSIGAAAAGLGLVRGLVVLETRFTKRDDRRSAVMMVVLAVVLLHAGLGLSDVGLIIELWVFVLAVLPCLFGIYGLLRKDRIVITMALLLLATAMLSDRNPLGQLPLIMALGLALVLYLELSLSSIRWATVATEMTEGMRPDEAARNHAQIDRLVRWYLRRLGIAMGASAATTLALGLVAAGLPILVPPPVGNSAEAGSVFGLVPLMAAVLFLLGAARIAQEEEVRAYWSARAALLRTALGNVRDLLLVPAPPAAAEPPGQPPTPPTRPPTGGARRGTGGAPGRVNPRAGSRGAATPRRAPQPSE